MGMSSAKIAVLFAERDRPEKYVISALADYWRQDGHHVRYLRGIREQPAADLLVLHVNLSIVPDAYFHFARAYPRHLNLEVRDITKRSFSSLIVSRDSGCEGAVIVKSNLNYGGVPEMRYHPRLRGRVHAWWQRQKLRRLSPGGKGTGSPYPIFPSVRQVPEACWKNPHWLVEKFVPERIDGKYAIRTYHFMGRQEAFFLLRSDEPFVKSETVVETRAFEPDGRLRDIRRQFRFDYGKFDYVLQEGRPVLLDLNKTVGLSGRFSGDVAVERARKERARGIYDFLT